ncbi:MAG: hypothetical protein ACRC2G_07715, partial [Aestuariivirga sp.]
TAGQGKRGGHTGKQASGHPCSATMALAPHRSPASPQLERKVSRRLEDRGRMVERIWGGEGGWAWRQAPGCGFTAAGNIDPP